MWGRAVGIKRWYYDNRIAHLIGIASVATDDAGDDSTCALCRIDRADDIRRDVADIIAASNRQDEEGVSRADPRHIEPSRERRSPAFVVGTRRQLGNIISGRVGFEVAQLAK